MPKRILLLLLFLICASTQSLAQMQTQEPILRSLSTVQDTEERAYIQRMYALFLIVDPEYAKREFTMAYDFHEVQTCVNVWARGYKRTWDEIARRLNYCDSLRAKGLLGTTIDDPLPDSRWSLFIQNGIPKNEIIMTGKCKAGKDCRLWTFIWPSAEDGQKPLEISCWSEFDRNYPTHIVEEDEQGFPLAHPIWPLINCSKFPSDSATDVWFSVWVPGDQFTAATLKLRYLRVRVELFDSTKSVFLDSASQVCDLQILRGVLTAASRRDRSQFRAMSYLNLTKLQPGTYNAHLLVKGDAGNEGDDWIKFEIPKDQKISDLLILNKSIATGDNVESGIIRGTKSELYDNPEALLYRNLSVYFEVTLPERHGMEFVAWLTLQRIPDIVRNNEGTISTSEPVVVEDSLGIPFKDGEWESDRRNKLLEIMNQSKSKSKTKTLLKRKFDSADGVIPVDMSASLESGLKSSKYLLTVTISDPEKKYYFISARRIIRVVASLAL